MEKQKDALDIAKFQLESFITNRFNTTGINSMDIPMDICLAVVYNAIILTGHKMIHTTGLN